MGGRKQTQTQNTTQTQNQAFNNANTYGWMTPPDTEDIGRMRDFEFTADPRVGYSFARTRRNIGDTYANPMGSYTTPALRDAMMRVNLEDIGQEEAQALREENYARQGLDYARRADVAAMTQPRMVQTGGSGTSSGTSTGSGTNTTVQTQSPWNSILQGGSAISSALIM
jgi:hypothetical protein